MRKAIQLQKKRHLKKISVSKHAYDDDDNYDSDYDEKPLIKRNFKQHDPLEIATRPKERERDRESTIFEKFPLVTERQLVELNAAITPGNRNLYVST